jgi:hypothetical protein
MAYLDPGAASIIIQGIIAGVVGIGAFFKLYWRRLRTLFVGRKTGPLD